MLDFIISQIYFILSIIFILFLPGYLLLCGVFKRKYFSAIEKIVLAIPVSFALVTLSMIISGTLGMPINKLNIAILFGIINLILFTVAFFLKKKDETETENKLFNFTKNQSRLIIILIALTIIIKSIYLVNAIFPTSTDLAHHMFWVEKIKITQELPVYKEIEIDISDRENPKLTKPQSIADFIVGEHLIFVAISLLSGQSVVSAFPSLILLIINFTTILIVFILTQRLFEKYKYVSWVSIFTLLFLGPLYAISSSQAKFVSGGAIGNIVGDLFIPTIFYFIYRAFANKRPSMLMMTVFLGGSLAYIHHLSAFIFGYAFGFSVLILLFSQINFKNILEWLKLSFKPYILILILFFGYMFAVFYVPSYLNKDAIESATGTPEKSTRIGIPINELMYSSGEARFALGIIGMIIIGLIILLIRHPKTRDYFEKISPANQYGRAITFGWAIAVLTMSLAPQYLKVNIISSRIANYVVFPITILAGFAIVWIFDILHQRRSEETYLPKIFVSSVFTLIFLFVFSNGMKDNSSALNESPEVKKAVQTYKASERLSDMIKDEDQIVKDHNYIKGDAFIKIFFAKDPNFPLSRALFPRYESNPYRETCTLDMISQPNSEYATKCFENLNVRFIVVHTDHDAAQFNSSDNFNKIYQNDELSIYFRKK